MADRMNNSGAIWARYFENETLCRHIPIIHGQTFAEVLKHFNGMILRKSLKIDVQTTLFGLASA